MARIIRSIDCNVDPRQQFQDFYAQIRPLTRPENYGEPRRGKRAGLAKGSSWWVFQTKQSDRRRQSRLVCHAAVFRAQVHFHADKSDPAAGIDRV
jgi:hypothetical protein